LRETAEISEVTFGSPYDFRVLDVIKCRIEEFLQRLSCVVIFKNDGACIFDPDDAPVAHLEIWKVVDRLGPLQHISKPANKIAVFHVSSELTEAGCEPCPIICVQREEALPFAHCRWLDEIRPKTKDVSTIGGFVEKSSGKI
jgi:hypothetical protein